MSDLQPQSELEAVTNRVRQLRDDADQILKDLESLRGWHSALGYSRATGIADTSVEAMCRLGQAAAVVALRYGVQRRRTSDDRFGTVNLFPDWVWAMAVLELQAASSSKKGGSAYDLTG